MTKEMDDLTEELGAYIESLKREIADLKREINIFEAYKESVDLSRGYYAEREKLNKEVIASLKEQNKILRDELGQTGNN